MYTFGSLLVAYSIEADGHVLPTSLLTNSIISNFAFNQSLKEISFDVTGRGYTGRPGYCNITFRTQLLGGPYTVLVDGAQATPTVSINATHTSLRISYMHSTHTIEVLDTTVIPEFPTIIYLNHIRPNNVGCCTPLWERKNIITKLNSSTPFQILVPNPTPPSRNLLVSLLSYNWTPIHHFFTKIKGCITFFPNIDTIMDHARRSIAVIGAGAVGSDLVELKKATALWTQSKVQVSASPSLLCARWDKLCWNIPFSGLAVAAGGITTDHIALFPDLRKIARSLMKEVIMAGNEDLAIHHEKIRLDRAKVIERMFRLTDTMGAYRSSTMIDFVQGRPMEIEAMFGEPLRRAESLGLSMPQLARLTALLHTLNTQR